MNTGTQQAWHTASLVHKGVGLKCSCEHWHTASLVHKGVGLKGSCEHWHTASLVHKGVATSPEFLGGCIRRLGFVLGTACGEGGFNLEVGKWRVFVAYHGMQDDSHAYLI